MVSNVRRQIGVRAVIFHQYAVFIVAKRHRGQPRCPLFLINMTRSLQRFKPLFDLTVLIKGRFAKPHVKAYPETTQITLDFVQLPL
ncbi:hypothetical protein D3C80_2002440 [compost metagenome]